VSHARHDKGGSGASRPKAASLGPVGLDAMSVASIRLPVIDVMIRSREVPRPVTVEVRVQREMPARKREG
jgi:hypothetical protein